MNNEFPVWHDHVAVQHIVSMKETYLRGVYNKANNRLIAADVFEQTKYLLPEKKIEKPFFIGRRSLNEVPLAFAQSGGNHWYTSVDYNVEGYRMIFDDKQTLVCLKKVVFNVVYNHSLNEFRRYNLKYTGEILPFKVWKNLKYQIMWSGKKAEIEPVYLIEDNFESVEIVSHVPVYTLADGRKVKPLFVGGNIYTRRGFSHFQPAGKMPAEIVKFF